MRRYLFPTAIILLSLAAFRPTGAGRIAPPPAGKLYHGVMAEDPNLGDEEVSPESLAQYEEAVGKRVAIVYFTNNWYVSRELPRATAEWIAERGCVPFVRLMMRSSWRQNRPERRFTLKRIIKGDFDYDLRRWASAARDFAHPLLVEYGTEFNGSWFSWNGWWNGRGKKTGFGDPALPDGPERFVAAWRHIVDIARAEGAVNITWVWHANAGDWPQRDWNRFENYYPGDDYVDWIAVSAYGPQQPTWEWGEAFRAMIDPWYARAVALAPSKPIYVAEFGCTHTSRAADNNPNLRADHWAQGALQDLFAARWQAVIGFSWWNEKWQNDNNSAHDTNMRVQDWKPLKGVFKQTLRLNRKRLQQKPCLRH
jgi:hypothetical protein